MKAETEEVRTLSVFEETTSLEVFDPKTVDNLIEAARAEAEAFAGDVSTRAGRDAMKSFAYKFATSKTHLLKLGKDAIAVEEEKVKKWKAGLKRVGEAFDECRDKVKAPALEWEEKEEKRKAGISSRIKQIRHLASDCENLSIPELKSCGLKVKELYEFDFEEFQDLALDTVQETQETIEAALTRREKYEADQAELKRLKEAEAEREAEIKRLREAEEKRKAEEAARVAEVNAAKEAEEAAKREAEGEAQRIKEAEEAAAKRERDRIAKETADRLAEEAKRKAAEKAKADAEAKAEMKRKADEKYRGHIRSESAECLRAWGMDPSEAASLILAIEKGEIAHVTLNF